VALTCVSMAVNPRHLNKLDVLNKLAQGIQVEDPAVRAREGKPMTWTPGVNFEGADPKNLRVLLGVKGNQKFLPYREAKAWDPAQIPQTFDARSQWANCPSISHIRDQGCCGDCWAVSAAESMSDRICIHSNAAQTPSISGEDLASCCSYCGDNPQNQTAGGCNGVYNLDYAWEWWITNGLVTGGGYESNKGCLPYEIPTTPPAGCTADLPTPACVQKCEPGFPKKWKQDLTWGSTAYAVIPETYAIQGEILLNGPVQAAFTVYEDFFNYTSGVYQHTWGQVAGGHAVRILGWGVENHLSYWLVANSWGSTWGKLGGFFKILRGVNECGIEENIVAGLPDLARSARWH